MGVNLRSFTVNVIPKPKQRPKGASYRKGNKIFTKLYTPEETLKYQENFAKEVLYQLDAKDKPLAVPCAVFLTTFKKDARRCDLDNFIKSALDACNKILYTDDYLVVRIIADMEKDSVNPRSVIGIMTADEYKQNPAGAMTEWDAIVENNRKLYKGKSPSKEYDPDESEP